LGSASGLWLTIKWGYIILTLFKAAYIVMSFMHLGDERKSFKWVILAPYTLFIVYLLFIGITESEYINSRAALKGNDKSKLEMIATPVDAPAAVSTDEAATE